MKKSTDEQIKEIKEPKTIKVRTVVISLIVAAAIAASFVAGWQYRSINMAQYNADVARTASSMVKTISKTVEQK